MLLKGYLEESSQMQVNGSWNAETKTSFRQLLREDLDKYVQEQVLRSVCFPLVQKHDNVDMERAFGVRWAHFVLKEATRRARAR